MNTDDFNIELCVFEARYAPAYALWDSAGAIWKAITASHPAFKLSTVAPNQQAFETESLQLLVELAAMRVNGREGTAIKEVSEHARLLVGVATEVLGIDSFTRIGFRLIKSKEFKAISQALKFARSDHEPTLHQQGTSRAFGGLGEQTAFTWSEKFETDKAGIYANLQVDQREWNFTVPWESKSHLPLVELSRKEYALVLNTDYYTIGTVPLESLDVATWILQASKAIDLHWSRE